MLVEDIHCIPRGVICIGISRGLKLMEIPMYIKARFFYFETTQVILPPFTSLWNRGIHLTSLYSTATVTSIICYDESSASIKHRFDYADAHIEKPTQHILIYWMLGVVEYPWEACDK